MDTQLTDYLNTQSLSSSSFRCGISPSKSQLENELRIAAEVGQALLSAYRATEKENKKLKMQIDELNQRLQELNNQNLNLLYSNDELLRTQADINGALLESNCRLDNLHDELSEARFRIVKLSSSKTQNTSMECQIQHLEQIREQLTNELDSVREDKRQADLQKYKAQRDHSQLLEQYKSLEVRFNDLYLQLPQLTTRSTKVSTTTTSSSTPQVGTESTVFSDLSIDYEEEVDDSDDSTIPTSPDCSFVKKHHHRNSSVATTILSSSPVMQYPPIFTNKHKRSNSNESFFDNNSLPITIPQSKRSISSSAATHHAHHEPILATFTNSSTNSKSLLESFL